jgi:hypothetical protein
MYLWQQSQIHKFLLHRYVLLALLKNTQVRALPFRSCLMPSIFPPKFSWCRNSHTSSLCRKLSKGTTLHFTFLTDSKYQLKRPFSMILMVFSGVWRQYFPCHINSRKHRTGGKFVMNLATVRFWRRNYKIYSGILRKKKIPYASLQAHSVSKQYFVAKAQAKQRKSRTCMKYNCRCHDTSRPEAPAEHFHACSIIQQPSGGIWVLASCSLRSPQLINGLHPTWVTCLVFTHFEHRLSQNQGASCIMDCSC